jgi:nucleoside-diphosphate-sugar epimerase
MSGITLITGASGFVGQNLIAYLQQNTSINVKPIKLRANNVTDAFDGDVKAVVHLAGKAHDLKNTSDPEVYFEVNTDLTKALFDQFLKSTATDFIFFSSVKAVADTVEGVLDENVRPNPKTPYGQSKRLAEEYLLSVTLPAGKRLFIMRPCMIHGPGNKGNLNLLYQVVKKGIPYPLAAFENKRSFLSIDNLSYVISQILNNPEIEGGVYNLADDEALPTTGVIKIIADTAGAKTRLWHISPGLIKKLAAVGDKIKLPLNSERLKKLTESYVVANHKIKKALHVTHLPVSTSQGLQKTIASFKAK